MARVTYFIPLNVGGSTVKYAWDADDNKYQTIAADLGITAAGPGEPGLVFGANSPKPPKIRINFEDGGSQLVFCDPNQMASVLGGSVSGKTSNGRTISKAGVIGS